MSDDVKNTNDEKQAAGSKVCWIRIYFLRKYLFFLIIFQIESKSHDELVKLVKAQILLKKQLDGKIAQLQADNVSLCQTEEVVNSLKIIFLLLWS